MRYRLEDRELGIKLLRLLKDKVNEKVKVSIYPYEFDFDYILDVREGSKVLRPGDFIVKKVLLNYKEIGYRDIITYKEVIKRDKKLYMELSLSNTFNINNFRGKICLYCSKNKLRAVTSPDIFLLDSPVDEYHDFLYRIEECITKEFSIILEEAMEELKDPFIDAINSFAKENLIFV